MTAARPNRQGTCEECGATFLASGYGAINKRCIDCDPNRANKRRRQKWLENEMAKQKGEKPPHANHMSASVLPENTPPEPNLAPMLVGACVRLAGGDVSVAARLAGYDPQGMDIEALERLVEQDHTDLINFELAGAEKLALAFDFYAQARLLRSVDIIPIGQLSVARKQNWESLEKAREILGVASGPVTVEYTEEES